METSKVALRKQYRAMHGQLSDALCREASQQIVSHLLRLSIFASSHTIALYVSDGHEADLRALFDAGIRSGKQCFFPRVEGDHLGFFAVSAWGDLTPGYRGILEPPESSTVMDPKSCDLICIPGLAFDRFGGRLGRGKGFYDRYLPWVRGVRVGIAFESYVAERLPMDGHDVTMDMLVTESGVWTFKEGV